MSIALQNCFTCGEICEDAWDRVDIQPVQKGVAPGTNAVCLVAGPLAKRRGFWRLGPVHDQAKQGRLIPFRKSINDALMLEFGDGVMQIWNADGTPLMNGGARFTFATPYGIGNVANLRWKQVGDIIYLFSSDGPPPYALERNGNNTTWSFTQITFPNGPWLTENTDATVTVTISGAQPVSDARAATGAQYTPVGQQIQLTASKDLFSADMVGAQMRLRANPNSIPVAAWAPGLQFLQGEFCTSVNNLYVCTNTTQNQSSHITNPPVHTSGIANDGCNFWQFLGDGAGIIEITAVLGPTQVQATVLVNLPIGNVSTSYFAFSAYSGDQGWPSAWPTIREERLTSGGTSVGFDQLDLSKTGGFVGTSVNYRPGAGTGAVLESDAIRRRVGDDASPIRWLASINYLFCGTDTACYLVAGQVLDQPLTPASVTIKAVDLWGVDPVAPVKAWDGLMFVAQGGQSVRQLRVDNNQIVTPRDLTALATHLNILGYAELAWVRQPDNTLWARMSDGGLSAYVYQQEQGVEGWFSQELGGGWVVESLAVIPGPFKRDTLWMIANRTAAGGAIERAVLFQSTREDALFYDGAAFFQGAPSSTIFGLDHYNGETVAIMGDGAEYPPQTVVNGQVSLPAGIIASRIVSGMAYTLTINTLRLNLMIPGGSMNDRITVKEARVSLMTVLANVGQTGLQTERVAPRSAADIPAPRPRRVISRVTISGDTDADPRLTITDSTGYDFRLYSIRVEADDDEA